MWMSVDVDAEEQLGMLRVVAEPMRWRILRLLAHEELCVCHLVDELDTSQPLVSHHLRVLRDAGVVDTARHRYWTYYRLRPESLAPLAAVITAIAEPPSASNVDRRRPCC
jgi:ArsR family transcriptional regulator, arsenate/arsenite/antimonite-responsive transcriptional repressor